MKKKPNNDELREANKRCRVCPNKFECPFASFTVANRKSFCLKFFIPEEYSKTNPSLIIPESTTAWIPRLGEFINHHTN